MSERTNAAYADAILAIASAEGSVADTTAELQAFAQAVEGNNELRTTLSDRLLPVATRVQIVDDLLANKASDVTRSAVSLVVSAGRGANIHEILQLVASKASASKGRELATVRSAVALTKRQKARLAKALEKRVGRPVDVDNIVDPSVVGGAVTTIGDAVLDGSVGSRLQRMHKTI